MFYSTDVLTKKGTLGRAWLAAHWEKKLNKHQIINTNLEEVTKSIEEPTVPLALRVSGHLLVGVVKIYHRKVDYLYKDAQDSHLKIKMAFKAGTKIDADERGNKEKDVQQAEPPAAVAAFFADDDAAAQNFVGDGDDFFVLESQAIPMDADGVDREDEEEEPEIPVSRPVVVDNNAIPDEEELHFDDDGGFGDFGFENDNAGDQNGDLLPADDDLGLPADPDGGANDLDLNGLGDDDIVIPDDNAEGAEDRDVVFAQEKRKRSTGGRKSGVGGGMVNPDDLFDEQTEYGHSQFRQLLEQTSAKLAIRPVKCGEDTKAASQKRKRLMESALSSAPVRGVGDGYLSSLIQTSMQHRLGFAGKRAKLQEVRSQDNNSDQQPQQDLDDQQMPLDDDFMFADDMGGPDDQLQNVDANGHTAPMTDFEAVFEGTGGVDKASGKDGEEGASISASQRTSTNGRSSTQIGTGWSLRSVKMLKFLQSQMPEEGDTVNFKELAESATPSSQAQGFLEMLVLMARGKVVLEQQEQYGDIVVHQAPGFFDELSTGSKAGTQS